MTSSKRTDKSRFLAHYRESDHEEQDLWSHLRQTADIAAAQADKIGLGPVGELLGLIHDLGKATDAFDQYIRANVGLHDPDEDVLDDLNVEKGKIDHSTAGAQVLYEYLIKDPSTRAIAEILSLVVASHHSGLIDCLTPSGENRLHKRLTKDPVETRKAEAWENLDPYIRNRIVTLLNSGITESISEVFKSSLEPGRDCDTEIRFKLGLLARFLLSVLIDADRLDTADFENPGGRGLRNYGRYLSWDILIDRLEHRLSQFPNDKPIDVLRREISDNCRRMALTDRGIYRLTVPTGGGKTLASLRFALYHAKHHQMDRIIYVIPYTSIIDQNAAVIRSILDPHVSSDSPSSIVLEHHSNLTPEIETSTQHRLLAENWDAPIVLTTMVQFLEALFGAGTRSCRRMHQLARAVIIFDEIQTLPVRCVHLFNVALRFLVQACGSTALLCTATQPLLDKVEPKSRALVINGEITPDVDKLYRRLRRVHVIDMTRPAGWSAGEIADVALTEMSQYGSALVVVNTKKAAAAIFKEVKARNFREVCHLSTNMCAAHRLAVLRRVKDLLDRRQQVICVSTQLIEAGVDIDFAVVIRSLAGLDSIAQAAGRCNRNGERPGRGRVLLVNPTFEHLDKLTDIKKARDVTARVIDEFGSNSIECDDDLLSSPVLERYFKYYFYERKNEMDYSVDSYSPVGRTDSLYCLLSTNPRSVAEYIRLNHAAPELVLRQSFMSAARAFAAIDQSGQGVIVPYEEGEEIIVALCGDIDFADKHALLRRAQRYSISLHPYDLRRHTQGSRAAVRETRRGSGILYLDKRYYDPELGFSDTVELMETLLA